MDVGCVIDLLRDNAARLVVVLVCEYRLDRLRFSALADRRRYAVS